MQKMRMLGLRLGVVMLAGCANLSPSERSALMEKEVEEMIQVYGPACEKLGYQVDSDPWRECILKLNTAKDLEYYNTQARLRATDCWSHRGFFRCGPY